MEPSREVRLVGNSPALIQPLNHQLQGVDVRRVEVLIDPEDVRRQEMCWARRVPRKAAGSSGSSGSLPSSHRPGLQQVDAVLAAEKVQEAAAQLSAQLLHLML